MLLNKNFFLQTSKNLVVYKIIQIAFVWIMDTVSAHQLDVPTWYIFHFRIYFLTIQFTPNHNKRKNSTQSINDIWTCNDVYMYMLFICHDQYRILIFYSKKIHFLIINENVSIVNGNCLIDWWFFENDGKNNGNILIYTYFYKNMIC